MRALQLLILLIGALTYAHLQDVPRGPRNVAHDGGVPLGQQVQQRGLARVGGAHDGHFQAAAHHFPPLGVPQVARHFGPQGGDLAAVVYAHMYRIADKTLKVAREWKSYRRAKRARIEKACDSTHGGSGSFRFR